MRKRKPFTRKQVRKHWASRLYGKKWDSLEEFLDGGDYCFACAFEYGGTEKAHIQALSEGGEDELENIHLLCWLCHKDSEGLSGVAYWNWFNERTIMDLIYSGASRRGLNVWSALKDFIHPEPRKASR